MDSGDEKCSEDLGSGSELDNQMPCMSYRIVDGAIVPNPLVETDDHLSHTGAGGMPWAYFIVGVDVEFSRNRCVICVCGQLIISQCFSGCLDLSQEPEHSSLRVLP